jgi:hypothetical protein
MNGELKETGMDDDFLYGLRREPSQDFTRRLRLRLAEVDSQPMQRLPARIPKMAAATLLTALVAVAFTFPVVRAGAQAFLDLFRVVNFAGVSFDHERLSELGTAGLDLPQLLGGQVEMLQRPEPPVSFGSLEDAGAAAGLRVRVPAWLPVGWQLARTDVVGETALRITPSTGKLQTLLDALAIDDLAIPAALDGQTLTVRVAPIVSVTYANGDRTVTLTQSRSPDVSFPAGLDLAVLAEIGLRILGLDRAQAYRFANSIDWRTTLVVPVPANAASFREVNVQGQTALFIEAVGDAAGPRNEAVIMWSREGNVYALRGALRAPELLEMAQTVQ